MRLFHRTATALAVAAALLMTSASPAAAATSDYLLLIEGIPGESTHEGHKGEIEIDSFSWGVAGSTRGKPTFQDIHFTSKLSIASPKLAEAVANGNHYPKAVLTGIKAGERPHTYLVITLEDILISSYNTSPAAGVTPSESFSMNYAKIEYKYVPQREDGSAGEPVTFCWNVPANRAC